MKTTPLTDEPAQEPVTGQAPCARQCEAKAFEIEIRQLQRALKEAQTVQEPVAWRWASTSHFRKNKPKDAEDFYWEPLYAAPQTATVQEPVVWAQKGYEYVSLTPDQYHTEPLYAAPQPVVGIPTTETSEPVNQQLLEALKRYVMQDETHDMTNNNLYKSAIDAIAAAEGKS